MNLQTSRGFISKLSCTVCSEGQILEQQQVQAPARPGSGPPELGREDKLILTCDECGVMENCGIVCGLWRPAPVSTI